MNVLRRSAGTQAVAEPQPRVALLRLQLDDEQADRIQRLLATGGNLGIADRPGQRQLYRTQADPADAVRFIEVAHSCRRFANLGMRWIIPLRIDTVQFINALD